MKKLKFILLTFITVVSFTACEKDEDLEFVANEAEGLTFNTSFLENYVLNSSVSGNLAERFTWNNADYGVPTNITYYLQGATMEDFSDYIAGDNLYDLGSNVANPEANEIPVTVGKMIALAEAAGLTNESENTNTGVIYFRLMAVIGDDGLPSYSAVQPLNVELQIQTNTGPGSGIMPATWGIVGSGYNDWGNGGPDGQFYTTSQTDVLVAFVTLIDGEIKFRENNAWDNDFGDDGANGTLETGGANFAVTAGTYKITVDLGTNTYTMENYSWGVVGSGYNDWGNGGPDAKFYYDYTTDTFKVDVKLLDGEVKFRLNNDWTTEFGGDNIPVTAGHYSISINLNDSTYTMETSDIWGIVGSGYNDWGNGGPDFALTQIQPGIYYGDIATLLDGEIKIRQNNDWAADFGDAGADGTLDAGGDNIVVTAGLYRVQMDTNAGTYMLNKIQ